MKRMRKYLIRTLLGVAAVVAAGFAATSCSDDSDSGSGVFRVEWDPTKTVHPDREGAAVLIVDGREGTSWRAEITAGAEHGGGFPRCFAVFVLETVQLAAAFDDEVHFVAAVHGIGETLGLAQAEGSDRLLQRKAFP